MHNDVNGQGEVPYVQTVISHLGLRYHNALKNKVKQILQITWAVQTFELRVYEQSRWVTTPLELDFLGIGLYRSFRRLFKYINGQNSEGIKMKMTVPVRMYVPRISSTDKNATMSFFVPSSVVNPPQPLNQEVYLESFPQKSIYVKSFSGYALKPVYEKKAKMLLEELTDLGLQFDSSYGTAAGYNDPLTIFDRHNEVWYTSL
uniref:Heme-binding protein 1 n=1 Tax=Leptobrachium leishanense TaxID=445787 RepID=A0A8C5PB76_9ANUR